MIFSVTFNLTKPKSKHFISKVFLYHTQKSLADVTPFWYLVEKTRVDHIFLASRPPERKWRGKSERDISRLHLQEGIFRQLKNNPLHIPFKIYQLKLVIRYFTNITNLVNMGKYSSGLNNNSQATLKCIK
jgi:hypothetical protein